MKLKNFQSNFQRCCQKIQKLKLCYTKKLKLLECTANYLNNFEYITSKSKLDQLYIQKANRIRIKMLLVYGEKSTSYFLNFEISAQQKSISNILKNGLKNCIEELGDTISTILQQKTTLLWTAQILRMVLYCR